jgi:lipopolysaccharide transport system ATP-binding protein
MKSPSPPCPPAEQAAVLVDGVSKQYRVYSRPQDRLKQALFRSRRYFREHWALRDVSLTVPRGQTLGIVGRNGCGKSTLLQIIAGTVAPTSGDVTVRGRVAALLELGAGFNPDYSGRENVFLNGAILGLQQREIEARYAEIVAFAELDDAMEQPLSTYSSGMFVRLAFAVATSVDPDVLLIDEALSVGDEAFQRKCFARLEEFQERGGTILFVSHSAGAVVELCDTACLLDQGELLIAGDPKQVIAEYHRLIYAPSHKTAELRRNLLARRHAPIHPPIEPAETLASGPTRCTATTDQATIHAWVDPALVPKSRLSYVPRGAEIVDPHLTTTEGERANVLVPGERYSYRFRVRFDEAAAGVRCGMLMKTLTGFELGGAVTAPLGETLDWVDEGAELDVSFSFSCRLGPGVYFLNAGVEAELHGERRFLHRIIDACMFRVQPIEGQTATGIVDFEIEPRVQLGPATGAHGRSAA